MGIDLLLLVFADGGSVKLTPQSDVSPLALPNRNISISIKEMSLPMVAPSQVATAVC
jgi:hypothetical protein